MKCRGGEEYIGETLWKENVPICMTLPVLSVSFFFSFIYLLYLIIYIFIYLFITTVYW